MVSDLSDERVTAEARARRILAECGVDNTERFTAGEIVSLANLIAENDRLAREVLALRERVAAMELTETRQQFNVELQDAHAELGLALEQIATLTRQRDEAVAVAREAIEALKGAPICCGQEFCGCVRDDRAADALRARLAAITGEGA